MKDKIFLNIQFGTIRSFLKTVSNAAKHEYSQIQSSSDEEKFEHPDDEANSYFYPMSWERIASKATLGELNALLEWEVQKLAAPAFAQTKNFKRKDKLVLVSDLNYNEIIKLIEKYYNLSITEVEHYDGVLELRSIVNAFKHRLGFKHPAKDNLEDFGEKFELSINHAEQSITMLQNFLTDLHFKIENKKA